MAVDVKKEIYGSRPSVIEPILKDYNVDYIKNIFVLTCRAEFNKNKSTRYLILIEFPTPDDLDISLIKNLSNCLKKDLKNRVVGVSLVEEEKKAYLLFVNNVNNKIKELSYKDLKDFLLKKTGCKYQESSQKGSQEATPLSRFFREYLGKTVSITDIDFFLPDKCLFMEEKTFIKNKSAHKVGYLGQGQCFSYKELRKDILNANSRIILVFVENEENFYIQNFTTQINCFKPEELKDWGKMIGIQLGKTISKENFLNTLLK